MEAKERTRAARRAARVRNARNRFAKWKIEMESWGCTVVVPDELVPPA